MKGTQHVQQERRKSGRAAEFSPCNGGGGGGCSGGEMLKGVGFSWGDVESYQMYIILMRSFWIVGCSISASRCLVWNPNMMLPGIRE